MFAQPFAALLLGITLVIWSTLLARRVPGEPLLTYESRRPVPWGLVDVLFAIGLLVVGSSVALALLGIGLHEQSGADLPLREPDLQAPTIYAQAAVSLVVVAVSAITILWRYSATGCELGLVVGKIGSDIRLGVVAFLAVAPPVYLMQLILVKWFESHHPLVEALRRDPRPPLLTACIVAAVCVAPIAEEYLFRGLLQGWLERLAADRDHARVLLLGGRRNALDEELSDECLAEHAKSTSWDAASHVSPAEDLTDAAGGSRPAAHAAYWPVAVSALIFAVLHLSHGPDWVPLFVLALGLGYVYRQTHRILPCIVVHFLLNACSMVMFLVDVFFPYPALHATLGLFGW
jgi:membrane protease YdiL (CAAX protease family)